MKLSGISINKINRIIDKKNYFYLYLYYFLLLGANIFELIGISSIPIFILALTGNELISNYIELLNIESFIYSFDLEIEILIGIALFIIFLLKNIYLGFLSYFQNKLRLKLRQDLKNKIYSNYIYSPYSFFLLRNPATLARNVVLDCNNSIEIIFKIITILKELILLILISTLLLLANPASAISVISILFISSLIFVLLTKNIMGKAGKKIHKASGSTLVYLQETFGSIKELKILNKHLFSLKKFTTVMTEEERNRALSGFIQSLPRLFLETVSITGIMLLCFFLIRVNGSFEIILPILTLYIVSIVRMMPSYNIITQSISGINNLMFSFEFIYNEIINVEKKNYVSNKFEKIKDFPKLRNKIILKDIHFSYEKNKSVLENINLEIIKNSKVGIIGPSGSGKSTLLDLITCLHTPQKGKIFCDDIDINSNKAGWQKKLGYVAQNIYLLDDTIKNNIAYGINEEEIENDKLVDSLKKSQLYTFVNSLQNKEETLIGNNGIRISGGQRQRIGIARALYTDPEIIIFDEATSSLDEENESKIMDDIDKLSKNKTIIIITHRLNSVKNCDNIFVLKNGSIIDNGKYKDLINSGII